MQAGKNEVMKSAEAVDPSGAQRAKLFTLLMVAGQAGGHACDINSAINGDGSISLWTEIYGVEPDNVDIPLLAGDDEIEQGYAFIESIKVAIEQERTKKELRKSAASKLTTAEKEAAGLR